VPPPRSGSGAEGAGLLEKILEPPSLSLLGAGQDDLMVPAVPAHLSYLAKLRIGPPMIEADHEVGHRSDSDS